jgi:hypothetical protein
MRSTECRLRIAKRKRYSQRSARETRVSPLQPFRSCWSSFRLRPNLSFLAAMRVDLFRFLRMAQIRVGRHSWVQSPALVRFNSSRKIFDRFVNSFFEIDTQPLADETTLEQLTNPARKPPVPLLARRTGVVVAHLAHDIGLEILVTKFAGRMRKESALPRRNNTDSTASSPPYPAAN